jgi:hypothetical protein
MKKEIILVLEGNLFHGSEPDSRGNDVVSRGIVNSSCEIIHFPIGSTANSLGAAYNSDKRKWVLTRDE